MPGYRTVLWLVALVGRGGGRVSHQSTADPPPPQQQQSGLYRVGSLYGLPWRSGGKFSHDSACQAPPTGGPGAVGALGL